MVILPPPTLLPTSDDSGSITILKEFVNNHSKEVTPKSNFDIPDLSDLLEIIRILIKQIISRNRKGIKKTRRLALDFIAKKTIFSTKLQSHFQGKKKIPP